MHFFSDKSFGFNWNHCLHYMYILNVIEAFSKFLSLFRTGVNCNKWISIISFCNNPMQWKISVFFRHLLQFQNLNSFDPFPNTSVSCNWLHLIVLIADSSSGFKYWCDCNECIVTMKGSVCLLLGFVFACQGVMGVSFTISLLSKLMLGSIQS